MASYTANYGLHQWEAADSFLRTDFNSDFSKIDGALKALADGQLCAVSGSYVGSGGVGPDAPSTLSFPFVPKVVVIAVDSYYAMVQGTVLVAGQTESSGIGAVNTSAAILELKISWSGNAVSWYTESGKEEKQLNSGGSTYRYWAAG